MIRFHDSDGNEREIHTGYTDELLAGGERLELEIDFSKPHRNQLKALDLLRYWIMDEGIARSKVPDVMLGDERSFRIQLPEREMDTEAQVRALCVRMTSERVWFDVI